MSTIPCLENRHFQCTDSYRCTSPTPELLDTKFGCDGSFEFQWKSSDKDQYLLSARGFSPRKMVVKCDCPFFYLTSEALTVESETGSLFVCKHLDAALGSVIDSDATADDCAYVSSVEQESSRMIPGLTKSHFTNGSIRRMCTSPTLLKGTVEADGTTFEFEWSARGCGGENYIITARGNIHGSRTHNTRNYWGFHVHCDCLEFEQQRRRRQVCGWQINFVCKHAAAALESCTDCDIIST